MGGFYSASHSSGGLCFTCTLLALLRKCLIMNGAGEGNRTLVSALGRPHSTIEPHPPVLRFGETNPPETT